MPMCFSLRPNNLQSNNLQPKQMNSIQLFICVVIIALPLLGCIDPAQQASSETVVEPQVNEETSVGLGSTDIEEVTAPTETPESTPEEKPVTEVAAPVYGDQFPEVLKVKAKSLSNQRWQFNVTLSSPYDSRQRYADAWRVLDDQGNELGIRILGHHHASEQPFTRSHVIELPENTTAVFVEGRDQSNGWSGQRFEFELP